jgi:hypothetical protein
MEVDAQPALEPDVEAFGATLEEGAAVVDGQMVSARACRTTRRGCASSCAC